MMSFQALCFKVKQARYDWHRSALCEASVTHGNFVYLNKWSAAFSQSLRQLVCINPFVPKDPTNTESVEHRSETSYEILPLRQGKMISAT